MTERAPRTRSYWLSLALIGMIGGLLSGAFAIGGGILMVPLLIWRAGMDQRTAAATSLVAIIPTAVVSSLTYLLNGEVDLVAAAIVAVGAIAGAVIGSALLKSIPLTALRWMFIVFILLVAVRLLLVSPERGHAVHLTMALALGYIGVGLIMGVASGLFGIGGGIIAVPLLISLFALSDLIAKGTSLLVSIPTSVVGTVANRRTGLVDVGAGAVVGLAASATSIPAVGLALLMSARLSGVLFALLLIAVAVQLSFKATRQQRHGGLVAGQGQAPPPPQASNVDRH